MVARAQRMDGTATGEHGVGIGKKVRARTSKLSEATGCALAAALGIVLLIKAGLAQPYVEDELGSGTVELLRRLKRTIDPQNIMVSRRRVQGPCFMAACY